MKTRFIIFALTLACMLMAGRAAAQITITFQPGPGNGFDTPIGTWGTSNYSTMNFSHMSEALAKAFSVGGDCSIARSLMKFDLWTIPANAIIQSAKLSLYYNATAVNPAHSGANASTISRVTSNWVDTLVTWSTQPVITTVGQVTLQQSISSTQDYLNIDVTNMVGYMAANPQQNYGMELGLINENCNAILTFCSSKHANAAKRPKLVVTYAMPSYVGIEENKAAAQFAIYPNPGSGLFNVSAAYTALEVFNLVGQRVWLGEKAAAGTSVDLGHLPTGIYVYKATVEGGKVKSGKLLIE